MGLPLPSSSNETLAKELMALLASFDAQRRLLGQHATLKTADIRLLWLFNDGKPRTLKEMSAELGLEQSTVNRQVNAAINDSLLTRNKKNPTDPYRFEPSEFGAQEFSKYMAATTGAYTQTFAQLGNQNEEFMTLMRSFVASFTHNVHNLQ